MSDPTHKIIIPVPLLHGKKAFLTGIDWNNKPASFRNVRSFAQSQNADFYLSYQYRDNESKDSNTMVAIFRRKEADIPRNIQKYYSLAMLIRPILKSGGYAIFDVPSSNDEKKYGFVSVVNEILVNDVTGTRYEIAEARNTFLMLNTEPENGWIRYEPEIFSENGKHTVLPLTTLTEAKKHPADARFTPVSMGKQLITASMFIALIGASWFAWQYYQNWQAEKTAQAMKDIPLDAIFSSPLERAQVTAKTIAQPHHLTVQVEPRIAEINFGQWEGLTFEEIETRWPGRLHEMYVHPDTVDIPGSETFGEAEARTMDFLNELIRTNKNKTFLIVSHGAAIRTMICGLLQLPLDRAWNLSQGNANITRIEALEEGRNILRTLNSTAHLRNEL